MTVFVPSGGGARTTTVRAGAAPTASVERVQVAMPGETAHAQPVPETLRSTVPGGKVSATLTEVAVSAPHC